MKPRKLADEQILDALKATCGRVYLAADKLGCHPSTIYRRAEASEPLAATIDFFTGRMLDIAEDALMEALLNREKWAVLLVLRTKGRRRGYSGCSPDVPPGAKYLWRPESEADEHYRRERDEAQEWMMRSPRERQEAEEAKIRSMNEQIDAVERNMANLIPPKKKKKGPPDSFDAAERSASDRQAAEEARIRGLDEQIDELERQAEVLFREYQSLKAEKEERSGPDRPAPDEADLRIRNERIEELDRQLAELIREYKRLEAEKASPPAEPTPEPEAQRKTPRSHANPCSHAPRGSAPADAPRRDTGPAGADPVEVDRPRRDAVRRKGRSHAERGNEDVSRGNEAAASASKHPGERRDLPSSAPVVGPASGSPAGGGNAPLAGSPARPSSPPSGVTLVSVIWALLALAGWAGLAQSRGESDTARFDSATRQIEMRQNHCTTILERASRHAVRPGKPPIPNATKALHFDFRGVADRRDVFVVLTLLREDGYDVPYSPTVERRVASASGSPTRRGRVAQRQEPIPFASAGRTPFHA